LSPSGHIGVMIGDPGRRSRDEKWFVELYKSAYGDVLRYARRRVDEDAARDAAAETFLVAWRRLDVVPAEPLPWLYGVARGVLANEFRRSQRQSRTASRIAESLPGAPTNHSDRISETEIVTAALATLSEGDREVITCDHKPSSPTPHSWPRTMSPARPLDRDHNGRRPSAPPPTTDIAPSSKATSHEARLTFAQGASRGRPRSGFLRGCRGLRSGQAALGRRGLCGHRRPWPGLR